MDGAQLCQRLGPFLLVGRQSLDTEDSIAASLRFNDRVLGSMQATGMVPKFMERFNASGCHLPAEMFKRTGDLR